MLDRAFETVRARPRTGRRSIIVDSHIGYGAPTKQDTHAAHGEPLGEEEIKLTKRFYGWPEDAKFLVPDGVREHFAPGHRRARGQAARRVDGALRRLQAAAPEGGRRSSTACSTGSCPRAGTRRCPSFPADAKGLAGRDASGQGAERGGAARCPGCIGGSADLAPSTKTRLTFEGAGRLPGRRATPAATSTSASASTPWARS